ncbi:MAG TPA: isoaspartyl peptidase/L-asparaginase [Acidimicrobiales bacterium]|nr:isoaspartyl peptidase/L-asparaginase [Acidimicrobiales bacterium]
MGALVELSTGGVARRGGGRGEEVEGAVLAVHGGAGSFRSRSEEGLARATDGLAASLGAGLAVLSGEGPAVDAVVAAVRVLEDDEEFNAGRGSVLSAGGEVEMDAAVADGASGRVGAVGAVSGVRNPVELARAVLHDRSSVLVVGAAASELATRLGLAAEPPDYFVTERRRREWQGAEGGTVGAVALDTSGNLAAATSTGGRAGKVPGRIGDSPVPGAGTWADNATCAVSATGDGEAFLLTVFAHEVDARVRLLGAALPEACRAALAAVERKGGTGGCIALSPEGRLTMPFTSPGMLRGWVDGNGFVGLAVFPDD